MLIEHFGLKALPFSKETSSASLYVTPSRQELQARLQFVIRQRAFGLITGDVGAGKSTAVRALHDVLDRSVNPFLYIADSSLTPKAFYREVLEQLGLQVPFHARQVRRRYEEAILDAYRRDGRQPVLVLDEAHLLSEPMLQEIRFLMLCRAPDYAEQRAEEGETERPRSQALGIIIELQEKRVVCREDDSGPVLY